MANIVEGLFHTVQGLVQSILAVLQAFFNVIWSIVHGVFNAVWGVLETFAEFMGASVHFVASNILILGVLAVAFVIYRDRNRRGTVGNNLKKKAQ